MTKKDKKFLAVDNFNLEIEDEEFIIFVGPSGCGKSTTLRMIAGLEEITAGEIAIDGTVVNEVHPKDRNIAMVFQNYSLYPHMTVFENMAFGLKLQHVPKEEIRKKVNAAAEILGITPYLDRKPKALSGGQRQRVALGRAIVRNPSVFLMDEPLSNLDAKLRVQMRTEISALHKKLHATIIYVTHDQVEAMTMGTRIVVMNAGVIQQIDSPTALYKKPANIFVAGFIGSPAMNFIDGTVHLTDGTPRVDCGAFYVDLIPEKAVKLADGNYDGKKVKLGIRPEHIKYVPDGGEGSGIIHAEATTVEQLGSEENIYFMLGETQFCAKAGEEPVSFGDAITLKVQESRIHLFDLDTTNTITN